MPAMHIRAWMQAGFVPDEIEIKPGDSVTWVNEDADVHTITSWREYQDEAGTVYADIGKIWDSGDIAPGKSFTRKFNEAGTFEYLSFPMYLYTIFQSQATGVVKVQREQ